MIPDLCSNAALARVVGLTERTIAGKKGQGSLPVRDGKIDLAALIRLGMGAAASGHSGADGEDLDLNAERARKAKEEADKLEMQNAQMRGELLARDDVNAAVVGAFARVRARLIGVPSKVAPVVVSMEAPAEAEAAIRGAVYEALKELAETSVSDLCGDDGGMVEDAGPPTGPDGEPVGGCEAEAES